MMVGEKVKLVGEFFDDANICGRIIAQLENQRFRVQCDDPPLFQIRLCHAHELKPHSGKLRTAFGIVD